MLAQASDLSVANQSTRSFSNSTISGVQYVSRVVLTNAAISLVPSAAML